ncbi:MAG: hypothetical protein ACYDDF_07190 [Thermoplasmatota archaeon]
MPRARRESMDDLLADLDEAGLELPENLAPELEYAVASAASFFARRGKTVGFDHAAGHRVPLLHVVDSRMEVQVPIVPLEAATELPRLLHDWVAWAQDAPHRTTPWLDATDCDEPEWKFGHTLYGEPTLFAWPTKPPRVKDPRLLRAEQQGWVPTLRGHNLAAGRGIAVTDQNLGLFITDLALAAFAAIFVHLATGEIAEYVNPFVEARFNDPDFQWWLRWGPGGSATEWKQVLLHTGEDDPVFSPDSDPLRR